ncbi:hypothetical protein P5673_003586 [Acropora cervicornis]|uniref:Uncharacterized protein n=1 Tax=Acropora cervicornis TaxID=6130 RepID=A0AAD9R0V7_ACRCE|nr:hypothetical protein P5673_003586 [Acropora cervicornis]
MESTRFPWLVENVFKNPKESLANYIVKTIDSAVDQKVRLTSLVDTKRLLTSPSCVKLRRDEMDNLS